ncbi:hypothetical protein ABT56_09850 [Photobacterium aquae]|uniref:Uncharacterized protein n=1 Tax=Photobacterium aquae TaxID=1195763 RepID=A0A0J1JU49_9GAMM|nr:hypothetical protein [Photobacterium aquae]KLV05832.1 hypothetical protein ABT56_09850 [Photobacterium aquae]
MTSMKVGVLALVLTVAGGWGATWLSLADHEENYDPLALAGVKQTEVIAPHWLDNYASSDLFSRDRSPLGEGIPAQLEESSEKSASTQSDQEITKQQVAGKQWKLVAIIKEDKAQALIEMADASFMTLGEGDELPDGRTINKIGTRQIWLADKNAAALTQVELFRFE